MEQVNGTAREREVIRLVHVLEDHACWALKPYGAVPVAVIGVALEEIELAKPAFWISPSFGHTVVEAIREVKSNEVFGRAGKCCVCGRPDATKHRLTCTNVVYTSIYRHGDCRQHITSAGASLGFAAGQSRSVDDNIRLVLRARKLCLQQAVEIKPEVPAEKPPYHTCCVCGVADEHVSRPSQSVWSRTTYHMSRDTCFGKLVAACARVGQETGYKYDGSSMKNTPENIDKAVAYAREEYLKTHAAPTEKAQERVITEPCSVQGCHQHAHCKRDYRLMCREHAESYEAFLTAQQTLFDAQRSLVNQARHDLDRPIRKQTVPPWPGCSGDLHGPRF